MTVNELITLVREEKPNSFSNAKLVSYINELEQDAGEQLKLYEIPVHTLTNLDENLVVPAPHDDIYAPYLKAKIDWANEEYASYQNNQAQFEQNFANFINWIVTTGQIEDKRKPTRFKGVWR